MERMQGERSMIANMQGGAVVQQVVSTVHPLAATLAARLVGTWQSPMTRSDNIPMSIQTTFQVFPLSSGVCPTTSHTEVVDCCGCPRRELAQDSNGTFAADGGSSSSERGRGTLTSVDENAMTATYQFSGTNKNGQSTRATFTIDARNDVLLQHIMTTTHKGVFEWHLKLTRSGGPVPPAAMMPVAPVPVVMQIGR